MHMKQEFYIKTFGCQMNQYDSEQAAGILAAEGYEPASGPDDADIILYNTCSVRDQAENKVRSYLGELKPRKQSEELIVGLMGCMAQRTGKEMLRDFPQLDFCIGTGALRFLISAIQECSTGAKQVLYAGDDFRYEEYPVLRQSDFQAWVPVIRGCNTFCTYCIVPHVRGRETSRRPERIIDNLKQLADEGVVEVTLLGQNIDAYGNDLRIKNGLARLLDDIAAAVPEIRRLRFATSHPRDMTPELLKAVERNPAVCPQLHMPAQSGSDEILTAMKRGYAADEYIEKVTEAYKIVTGLDVISDFIVGFPGESRVDFQKTEALMKACDFQKSHIFKYSSRPGTRAASFEDNVPRPEKDSRNQALLAIQKEMSTRRNKAVEGRTFEVLTERHDAKYDNWIGRTASGRITAFKAEGLKPGDLVTVTISKSNDLTLFGEQTNE